MSKKNPQAGDVFFNSRGCPGWPMLVVHRGDGEGLEALFFCYPKGNGGDQAEFKLAKDDTKVSEFACEERWKFLFNISGVELEELIKDNWKKGVYDNVPQD